jgi:hypothetical protein
VVPPQHLLCCCLFLKTQKALKKPNKNVLNLRPKGPVFWSTHDIHDDMLGSKSAKQHHAHFQKVTPQEKMKVPIKCSCPFPRVASLRFDLVPLMSPLAHVSCHLSKETTSRKGEVVDSPAKESPEGRLLRFSLCFLHLWGVDAELDRLLVEEMNVCKSDACHITAGT